jgi:NAD(P)-dependent dehydrogenase (short-subunit alcohol dehydrogenase family)
LYIVTGSGSGIGKSVYKTLKETDPVIGIDILQSDIVCDLSYEKNIKELVSEIINSNKEISGIITCAGVVGGDSVISTNYFGSIRLVEYLYAHYGKINAILIGSIIFTHTKVSNELIDLLLDGNELDAISFARKNNLTDTEIYASCKLALNFWARRFIKNNPNSRINVIHPSLTKTGMTEKYLKSEVIKIIFAEDIHKAYLGEPEEVSGLVCYLIKNSKFVNGQSIFIDDGVYSV